MDENALDKFIGLRDRIKNLRSVKCKISHERVRIDNATGLPLTRRMPERIFERKGLCPPEIRRKRITCGHTMARYDLVEALEMLEVEGANTKRKCEELNELTDRIHALDHKKGFAEARLGNIVETQVLEPGKFPETELRNVRTEIREIESQHDDCVEKISALCEKILDEMDELINKSA